MVNTNRKHKILFVSWMAVHNNVSHAGGKTLNYYLSRFCDSLDVDIRLLTSGRKDNNDFVKMQEQFSGRIKLYYSVIPLFAAVIRKLYYKFNFNFYLSYINAKFAHLDFVSKRYFKRGLTFFDVDDWCPDIVILEWPEMLCLYKEVHEIFPSAKIIISEVDVAYQRYSRRMSDKFMLRAITTRIYSNLKLFELEEISKVDFVVVQSVKDKMLLVDEGVSGDKIISISPYYSKYAKHDHGNSRDILFWGAMNRSENIEAAYWFINNVLKLLKKNNPDTRFIVVGGGDKSVLSAMAKHEGVITTGFVLDPSPYFNDCFCLVVPLIHGAGIKVKVIEGMAAGLPVLTGNVGIEGIEAYTEQHYLHCETADDYIAAIQKISSSPSTGENIGRSSQKFIAESFNYDSSFLEYHQLITKGLFKVEV